MSSCKQQGPKTWNFKNQELSSGRARGQEERESLEVKRWDNWDRAQKRQFENACSIQEGDLFSNLTACTRGEGTGRRPSKNKGAGKCYLPALLPSLDMQTPRGTNTMTILNLLLVNYLTCKWLSVNHYLTCYQYTLPPNSPMDLPPLQ